MGFLVAVALLLEVGFGVGKADSSLVGVVVVEGSIVVGMVVLALSVGLLVGDMVLFGNEAVGGDVGLAVGIVGAVVLLVLLEVGSLVGTTVGLVVLATVGARVMAVVGAMVGGGGMAGHCVRFCPSKTKHSPPASTQISVQSCADESNTVLLNPRFSMLTTVELPSVMYTLPDP